MMNTNTPYFVKYNFLAMFLLPLSLIFGLSACSQSTNNRATTEQSIKNQQIVETGTVVSVRKVNIEPEKIDSYGNFGVAASSGGFRGIYGSIDLGTLSRIFRNTTGVKIAQEVIVKKASGETVAITQKYKEDFKTGDAVKILIKNGNAQVVR